MQAVHLVLDRIPPLLGAQLVADMRPELRDRLRVLEGGRIERLVALEHRHQIRHVAADPFVHKILQDAVNLHIECLVIPDELFDELADILAEREPLVAFDIQFAEPPPAQRGVFRLLAEVELPVAPEALDDVEADVAGVGGRDHVVPREAHDPHERRAERHIAQVADVELLVRVHLRVLDHHPLGDRRATAIIRARREDIAHECGGDLIGIEDAVDVAILGAHIGEVVEGAQPLGDTLGDLRRPSPCRPSLVAARRTTRRPTAP